MQTMLDEFIYLGSHIVVKLSLIELQSAQFIHEVLKWEIFCLQRFWLQ